MSRYGIKLSLHFRLLSSWVTVHFHRLHNHNSQLNTLWKPSAVTINGDWLGREFKCFSITNKNMFKLSENKLLCPEEKKKHCREKIDKVHWHSGSTYYLKTIKWNLCGCYSPGLITFSYKEHFEHCDICSYIDILMNAEQSLCQVLCACVIINIL